MSPRASVPTRTYTPRLETLGDRVCPVATATKVGSTLVVLGDSTAGDDLFVSLRGNGRVSPVGVTVVGNPPLNGEFTGITHLVVKGRGGNDQIRVAAETSRLTGPLTIQVDLGSGDNSADVNLALFQDLKGLFTPVNVSGGVRVFVQGGAGADGVSVRLGAVEGRADVRARLGAGDDAFDGFVSGGVGPGGTPKAGLEAWDVRGGAGDDSLNLYTVAIDVAPNSRLVATLRGEAGDDTVGADVNAAAPALNPLPARTVPAPVQITLDGGDGTDTVIADLVLRTPQANPTGTYYQLAAALRGGAGDDDLWLTLDGGQDQRSSKATVDGGAGADTYVGPTGLGILKIGIEG